MTSEPRPTVNLRNPLSRETPIGVPLVLSDGRHGWVAGLSEFGKVTFVQPRDGQSNHVSEIWAAELRDHRVQAHAVGGK